MQRSLLKLLGWRQRTKLEPAIYDGIEIAGTRGWERCEGGWFKTAGVIHVHTIEIDGVTYVDSMRIEELTR